VLHLVLVILWRIIVDVEIRFSRSARKHRIGKAHAMHVINTTDPVLVPATEKYDEQWVWSGDDDRGPDCMLIIHVQPTTYEHQEADND
jgi:hypothetical protein